MCNIDLTICQDGLTPLSCMLCVQMQQVDVLPSKNQVMCGLIYNVLYP